MIDTQEYYGGKYPSPPDPIEVGTKEVKIFCTVSTYLNVPADLENRIDIKNWIEQNKDTMLTKKNIKDYIFYDSSTEILIDEIEK